LVEPAFGPYLFDTSAQSWLERSADPLVKQWVANYLLRYPIHVSAVTVMERVRGYALLEAQAAPERREFIATTRRLYLDAIGVVHAVDGAVALLAGELSALLRQPPSPPKRAHHLAESRQDRLVRWRSDILIAATALVANLPLVHHNPLDFETIRMVIETTPGRFPGLGPLNLVNVLRLTS